MRCDFEIRDGIYLCQSSHKLDLHNNFDFDDLRYSVADRIVLLRWRRSKGNWVSAEMPASVSIEFREVSEFRFLPRDAGRPFTEDDCASVFGYWTDEDWADGVIVVDPSQEADPRWLTAIDFMSGAVIAIQAASAHAKIC